MSGSGTGTPVTAGSGTLVSAILTAVGYRLEESKTITSTSDPNTATCIQWMNEIALWITGICAESDSDLGKTIGAITTIVPSISAATKASPCAITTAAAHGLATGDIVVIKDVAGMTELNDVEYTFTKTAATTGTLGVDSSAYTTYASGGYLSKRLYNDLAATMYAPTQEAWIVDGRQRNIIKLSTEKKLVDYDPAAANEPAEFYVDGANNVCFFEYPDAAYTIKVPYWQLPTALTQTTETIPFLGLMNNVFIEAVALRYFNRNEYDTTFELKWQSFLLSRVRNVIEMRKKMTVQVTP